MARHFTELVAWQRAHALRTAVWEAVRAAPGMDLRLRSQITDAAGSTCRNIAEGFRRRSHRDFARYLEHATSSLSELEDGILDARMRDHLSEAQVDDLSRLVRRTSAPLARLLRYLRHTPDY
ncbi:MAG TPA: four helix bundle protein [Vicinamibacterales bacterium]|nr:four helix bundle protein [Vicinamibacterales bacterium]